MHPAVVKQVEDEADQALLQMQEAANKAYELQELQKRLAQPSLESSGSKRQCLDRQDVSRAKQLKFSEYPAKLKYTLEKLGFALSLKNHPDDEILIFDCRFSAESDEEEDQDPEAELER